MAPPSMDECPEGDEHDWVEKKLIPDSNDESTPTTTKVQKCRNCGMRIGW